MNATELKRSIVQKGVEKLLDEAKVPQRIHLQVIQALAKKIEEHKQEMRAHETTISQHQNIVKNHERQIAQWEELSKQLTSITHLKGDKGDSIKGDPGKDAEPIDEKALVERIIEMIRIPKDGEPGKDAIVDEDKIITNLIKKLQKDKPLDISHIRNAQTFIKDGVKYKIEELMRGAGGGTGTANKFVYNEILGGSGQAFTFATTPIAGLYTIYARGQKLIPTTDYTVTGANVSTTDTFSANDLMADYQHL